MTRTLAKLEVMRIVAFQAVGRRKAPRTTVRKILVEIDPFMEQDRLKLA